MPGVIRGYCRADAAGTLGAGNVDITVMTIAGLDTTDAQTSPSSPCTGWPDAPFVVEVDEVY